MTCVFSERLTKSIAVWVIADQLIPFSKGSSLFWSFPHFWKAKENNNLCLIDLALIPLVYYFLSQLVVWNPVLQDFSISLDQNNWRTISWGKRKKLAFFWLVLGFGVCFVVFCFSFSLPVQNRHECISKL